MPAINCTDRKPRHEGHTTIVMQQQHSATTEGNDRGQAQFDNSDCRPITDAQSQNYRKILQLYTIVTLTLYALLAAREPDRKEANHTKT